MNEPSEEAKAAAPPAIMDAFDPWLDYTARAEALVHLTYEGLSRVQMIPQLLRIVRAEEQRGEAAKEQLARADARAAMARLEEEGKYAFLHAQSLLGLWGALECMVEDVFMARLSDEPALLSGESFRKMKLPVALLAAGDPTERLRAMVTEMTRATDADLAQGVGKFERLLSPVGLGGATPRTIRDAVFNAQQVRNVWAHRAGIADQRFVERCPRLGFGVGDRVDLDGDGFLHLMHGLHMYGVVIVNRCLALVGRDTVKVACPGYESVWDEVNVTTGTPEGRPFDERGGDGAPKARS